MVFFVLTFHRYAAMFHVKLGLTLKALCNSSKKGSQS